MANPKFADPIDDFLDQPIAFNPSFKRITGSTVAAVFLSQAWYWTKRHKKDDGWFWKTGEEWEEETGLTRSEQETARKHCRRVGVVEEKLRGVPATMHYRVDKKRIYELLGIQFSDTFQFAEIPQTGSDDSGKFAESQQSDVSSNFNKESENPPKTPYGADAPAMPLDWQLSHDMEITQSSEDEEFKKQALDIANLIEFKQSGSGELAYAFMTTRNILLSKDGMKGQAKAAREMIEARVTVTDVIKATKQLMEARDKNNRPFTVVDLFSIRDTAIGIANAPPEPVREVPIHRAQDDGRMTREEAQRKGIIK